MRVLLVEDDACYGSTPGRSGSTRPLPSSTAPIRKISSTSCAASSACRSASRFPRQGTCLAIYSYTINASCPLEERGLETVLNHHTGSPSDNRNAPIQPLTPYSLTPVERVERAGSEYRNRLFDNPV